MSEESSAPDPLEGTMLANGRYQIIRRIGTGGMGAVYQACQVVMGRMVALKLIHPHLGDNNQVMVGRFLQEMRSSAAVEHPNTIRVYDFGETEDGRLFLAMEYLEGRTLRQLLESEAPLPENRVIAIAIQIAKALGAVHSEGVVHRDLKPENVMLLDRYGEQDFVKVLDFGIARFFDEAQKQMTITGAVIGTPAYMSPEQASGADLDGRSDLYSLGIVLFRMVTGQLPFDKPDLVSLLMAQINQPPPPVLLHAPHLSPGMASLIMQLLAKEPNERPPTAIEVIRILSGLHARPIPLGVSEQLQATGMQATLPISSAETGASNSLSAQIYGSRKRKRKWLVFFAAMLAVIGGFLLAASLIKKEQIDWWKRQASQIVGSSGQLETEEEFRSLRAEINDRLVARHDVCAPIDCQVKQLASLRHLAQAVKWLGSDNDVDAPQKALNELEMVSENAAEKWALMAHARFPPGTAGRNDAQPRAILSLHSAERAVALCPHYAGAYYLLGRAAQLLGRQTVAAKAFARSYQLNSNYHPTQFNMAVLRLQDGNFHQAVHDLSRIIREAPEYPHVFTVRGEAYFKSKEWNRAVDDFEEAARRNPQDCEAWLGLGKGQFARNEFGLAADALVKALDCNRRDGRVWFYLGETFVRTHDFDEANKAFCRAKALGIKEAAGRCRR